VKCEAAKGLCNERVYVTSNALKLTKALRWSRLAWVLKSGDKSFSEVERIKDLNWLWDLNWFWASSKHLWVVWMYEKS